MSEEKTVSIVQIANEMKVTAKRARAVLRAAEYKRKGTRWTFPVGEKEEIKRVIRESRKRATITVPKKKPTKKSTKKPAEIQAEDSVRH